MPRFKTAPVDESNVGSWVERRRKGRMVRKQHTVTAAWTEWMISPKYLAEMAVAAADSIIADMRDAGKAAQRTAETMAEFAETVTPDYQRMTVPELRTLANDHYGVKVPSKARKADVIGLILAAREGI